jgi:GR25 family glycosyltransferase involved in LPS biosynthesis
MSNNIDKIIYINLNKSTDRREQIEKELNNFNLQFERFEAFETSGFGILGCGLSHLQVLKIAEKRNYDNILILEDDFTFLVTKEVFEEELTKFFNLNIDYDVCMLSYNLIRYENTSSNFIIKALEVQTASGYIVNKKYYNKLINLYEQAMPLLKETQQHWIYANDQIWKQYQEKDNWYCFSTRIGKQRSGYNCDGIYCDYNC